MKQVQSFTAYVLTLSLLFQVGPTGYAYADDAAPDLNKVGAAAKFLKGKGLKDYRSTCVDAQDIGLITQGDCASALAAMNQYKADEVKTLVFATAAATCVLFGTVPYLKPAGAIVCPSVSVATSAFGFTQDMIAVVKSSKASKSFEASVITNMGAGAVGLGLGVKELVDVVKNKKSASTKNDCIGSSITLGVASAVAGVTWGLGKKKFDDAMKSAKSIKDSGDPGPKGLNTGPAPVFGGNNGPPPKTKNMPAPPAPVPNDCSSASGDAYLQCIGQNAGDPVLDALTNSPDFMNTMQKALNGKSLGDFAKGFDGNPSDVASYVAKGLGLKDSGLVQKTLDASNLAAKEAGFDAYTPLAYSRPQGNATSVASQDLNFNKMMEDMMKKLNPEAKTADQENPQESAFRQLDLLPEDKITANRDISLFARVGFRYRKDMNQLERLNWSLPANQGASASAEMPSSSGSRR